MVYYNQRMFVTPPQSPRRSPVCPGAPKKENVVPYATYRGWIHWLKTIGKK